MILFLRCQSEILLNDRSHMSPKTILILKPNYSHPYRHNKGPLIVAMQGTRFLGATGLPAEATRFGARQFN